MTFKATDSLGQSTPSSTAASGVRLEVLPCLLITAPPPTGRWLLTKPVNIPSSSACRSFPDAVIALESVTVTVLARSTYDFSYTVDELIVGDDLSFGHPVDKRFGGYRLFLGALHLEKIAGDGDITFTTDSQGRVHIFINSGVWARLMALLCRRLQRHHRLTLNLPQRGAIPSSSLLDLTTNAVLRL